MKLKLVFILITIYTVPLPAMMNKLRLHHARSVRDRSGNQIKVDKPVKVDKSVPGIFYEHFCPDIDYKIIDSMTVDCGKIDFANTCKGMNSLAQVNKFLNEYMNHDKRTLDWIKQLSTQFKLPNDDVARKLCTKEACKRYFLQMAAIGYDNCKYQLRDIKRGHRLGLVDINFTYDRYQFSLFSKFKNKHLSWVDIYILPLLAANSAGINTCQQAEHDFNSKKSDTQQWHIHKAFR